jgi:PAS domain S-box-containing protein
MGPESELKDRSAERTCAGEGVHKSEPLAQAANEAVLIHLCVLDETGTIISVNQQWREFAASNQADPDKVSEKINYLAVCDAAEEPDRDSARAFADGIRAVMQNHRRIHSQEYPCHSPDEKRWFVGQVTKLAGNGPARVVVVHKNITDTALRVRAEQALRESEERFRQLFDRMSSGVAVYEAAEDGEDFIFRDFNQAAELSTGVRRDELLGRCASEVFPGVRQLGLLDVFRRVWRTGVAEKRPAAFYQDQSLSFWVENFVYRLPSGEIVAIFDDITERKRAEEALRISEGKYRSLYESMRDGFVRVAMDGAIIEYNQAYRDLLGYTDEELSRLTYRDITPTCWYDSEEQIVREQIIPRGYSEVYEKEYRRKDGTLVPIEIRTCLERDADGHPNAMWAIIRDITEGKQILNALQASLHEKDVLMKELHHRVKNNLQVVNSLLNLQARKIQDPKSREMFQESQGRVKAIALIHEMLYQSDNLGSIGFRAYIQKLASHLARFYKSQTGQVQIRLDMPEFQLSLDSAIPCALIIHELVTNAAKHAFEPGQIGQISISMTPIAGNGMRLIIADDGRGLPPGLEITQSPTLGLQLVTSLVDQLNGELTMEREAGTRFIIIFPLP